MQRIYQKFISNHFKQNRQMLFLMGPRQVGKTTLSLSLKKIWKNVSYYSWDSITQRESIIYGPDHIAAQLDLETHTDNPPVVIFDEIHKFDGWKLFLKGFYDTYPSLAHILVIGSARLDVYQRGGDSLMGRYLMYRVHPLSVSELARQSINEEQLIQSPKSIKEELFENLMRFGGFPDPFLKANARFYNQWKRLRLQQLFEEDLRDLTQIHDIDRLEVLAELIRRQAGQLTSYTSLSKKVRVNDKTIRSWLSVLRSVYFCFAVRPWSKSVAQSILKEPKYYLWDWALCEDEGQRAENMVASHLLKAVHFWTDHGFGEFGLYYLRDKQKREVDFVVVKDNKPWFLVEVKKSGSKGLSSSLHYFHKHLSVPHSFQVVFDQPFVKKSCFTTSRPIIVSAKTFLSQLV